MTSTRRIPWTIEWSAALFVGVAVFFTVVEIGSESMAQVRREWFAFVLSWACFGGVALAVVKGASWVRGLFLGLALLKVVEFLMPAIYHFRPSAIDPWIYGIWIAATLAAVLCFLPPSARYFRAREQARQFE